MKAVFPTTPTSPPRFLSFHKLELPPVSPLSVDMEFEGERNITELTSKLPEMTAKHKTMTSHKANLWNAYEAMMHEKIKLTDPEIKKLVQVPETESLTEAQEELFNDPCSSTQSSKFHFCLMPKQPDARLQCTNKRRRYMRRGARSPSMFSVSKDDLEVIESTAITGKNTCIQSAETKAMNATHKFQRRGRKSTGMLLLKEFDLNALEQNRHPVIEKSTFEFRHQGGFDLVSALKLNMERSSVIEPEKARKIGQMSATERRRFTCELLSEI